MNDFLPPTIPTPVAALALGPDARWLFRHARENGANAFHLLRDVVADFGDVVRYRTPFGIVYFFNHPAGAREPT